MNVTNEFCVLGFAFFVVENSDNCKGGNGDGNHNEKYNRLACIVFVNVVACLNNNIECPKQE